MNANLEKQRRLSTLKNRGAATGVVGAVLLSSQAYAFDIGPALTGNSTLSNIDIAGLFVLGVVVTIWGIRKINGFFAR